MVLYSIIKDLLIYLKFQYFYNIYLIINSMNITTGRIICVIVRLSMIISALFFPDYIYKIFGLVLTLVGIGFIVKYINYDTSIINKGFFGSNVWWNDYRLVHGLIYLLFGIIVIYKHFIINYSDLNSRMECYILLLDPIIALVAFILN